MTEEDSKVVHAHVIRRTGVPPRSCEWADYGLAHFKNRSVPLVLPGRLKCDYRTSDWEVIDEFINISARTTLALIKEGSSPVALLEFKEYDLTYHDPNDVFDAMDAYSHSAMEWADTLRTTFEWTDYFNCFEQGTFL